jgi:hypothetical protein
MQLAKHAGFQAVDSGLGRMIAEDGRDMVTPSLVWAWREGLSGGL